MKIQVVWQPRFSTRDMLIKTSKVSEGENYMFFSSDPNWPDIYKFDGSKVLKECSTQYGNYVVPLSWLVKAYDWPINDITLNKLKASEDSKYHKYLESRRKKK